MADFEKNHPGIAAQELWKLFLRKAEEQGLDRDFISAVGEVCAIGLNLSKYIVRFFPTFTLHDETHSANVCRWMWVLLGEQRAQLTAHEAALLLMAACCHDIGMAVSPEQEEQMRLRTYPGWDYYFRQNLKDDEEYEKTKVISDRMLRNFVRMHHHERIGENLRQSDWPGILNRNGITRETLLKLCRSHGTELFRLELRREPKFDLLLCAVLLRLADLLNYDTSRAPAVLFRHMGLDRPANAEEKRSAVEYGNNQAGIFDETIVNDVISYYAEYDNPQQEQEVQGYLDWVTQELKYCAEELAQTGSAWRSLRLPYRINADGVVRNGYAAGKFCMTMDQDKIIDLLTGENLYSDAGVFVRELLQNSIDAVLMRAKQDPNFSLEDGLIQIDTWMDEEANTWFRIRDNGTGMNEHIIQNHFLKVGNSYYTSEEFQYANRHAPKGGYTAISRFGIGILSCFMGDKEHTQLKVSTKRFDEKGKSGIRLDVTGLHGYYFLCKEKKHPESEPWFPKMPSQDEKDRGYRTEPGTTICVNTNLLRMGELRSFQEILDKYVQFPEVRVTYNGPEGYKEYPTQQELMEAVYALNPDGVVKEYVHEIPDVVFEKLKTAFPHYIWETKPTFTLRYEPLDWLSDSPKLTGVRIWSKVVQPQMDIAKNVEGELARILQESVIRAQLMGINRDGISVNIRRYRFRKTTKRSKPVNLQETGEGLSFRFSFIGSGITLSESECCLLGLLCGALQNAGTRYWLTAYNGVLVDIGSKNLNCFGAALLKEDFQPQVNVARDGITNLSVETQYCFEMSGLGKEILGYSSWRLATEREIAKILAKHPKWEREQENSTRRSVKLGVQALDYLWLAYWKRRCKVWLDGTDWYAEVDALPDKQTADFPVIMFMWMKERTEVLFHSIGRGTYYNRTHPFAQWLIVNRTILVEKVPALYDTMIRTMMRPMVLKGDSSEILNTLNNTLNALRNYPGNPFHVPTDLVLTEADFIVTD